MAKATLKLIQELRAQLPPEAADKLDDLEHMASDGDDESGPAPDDSGDYGDDSKDPGPDMGDDEGSDESDDDSASAMDEGSPEEEASESDDEEAAEQKTMKGKMKPKKKGLSFFA